MGASPPFSPDGQRMTMNLYDQIRANAPADPGMLCLETADGRRFGYGDLERLSGQIANALQAQGVLPGDRVAVQVEKSPEVVFLYLACLRL
ncbi:MAG TPA: AMP-binding protein, partial [Geminicoccaceae bacterium]|nr:AMP-binding protein [Geminicoccaceae bacterium]